MQEALSHVNTSSDQDLYITYNVRAFSVPGDWAWEPCAGYYDTGDMVLDPAPKVFLQNKLTKCRTKLQEVNAQIEAKSDSQSQAMNKHTNVHVYFRERCGQADEDS